MMDTLDYIVSVMKQNREALGFIPDTSIRHRYIKLNRYIIQYDSRGKPVGYLLHGSILTGKPCVISQACIEYDHRHRYFGSMVVSELIRRCNYIGASSIKLRVADDLDAIDFWRSVGFSPTGISEGGKSRGRMIIEMRMLLNLPMFNDIDGLRSR